ncbi:hypothetical protein [Frankia canadensis]|uniref:hypothetical protein n=1 Tax=Frankia canadensis TaxID=1836972 RepID=UPI0014029726|nr:hypothetical protein [Frankia canadensis]
MAPRPAKQPIDLTVARQARSLTPLKDTKEDEEIVENEPMEPLHGVVELEPSRWSRGA